MRTVVFDGVEIPETLLAGEVQNHPGATAASRRYPPELAPEQLLDTAHELLAVLDDPGVRDVVELRRLRAQRSLLDPEVPAEPEGGFRPVPLVELPQRLDFAGAPIDVQANAAVAVPRFLARRPARVTQLAFLAAD